MKVLVYLPLFFLSSSLLAQNNNYIVNVGNFFSNVAPYNTVVGIDAGTNIQSGYNVFVGYRAGTGFQNPLSGQNTFIGSYAGQYNDSGRFNTFLGYSAGSANNSGSWNSFLSANSGQRNTSGEYNTFVGQSAGEINTTGSRNTFVGQGAGTFNKVTNFNTFIGYRSGFNAVADSNTFVGYQAGYDLTTGRGNVFFGINAGRGISTGSHNTIMGNKAGPASTDTDDNVYIGYNTGSNDSGSDNTFIGTKSDALAQYLHHATAIGADATIGVSNAVVLGHNANVGIGTSMPTARLHVRSDQADESGIRLEQLTSRSPVAQSTDQFLTVNERGDVVKARYQLRINTTNEWSDKVFAPTYQLLPLDSVANYVREQGHLPGLPSATEVVKEGVDLAKMNATLLEKIEELTLYLIQQQKRIEQLEIRVKRQPKP